MEGCVERSGNPFHEFNVEAIGEELRTGHDSNDEDDDSIIRWGDDEDIPSSLRKDEMLSQPSGSGRNPDEDSKPERKEHTDLPESCIDGGSHTNIVLPSDTHIITTTKNTTVPRAPFEERSHGVGHHHHQYVNPTVIRRKRTVDATSGSAVIRSCLCQEVWNDGFSQPMDPKERQRRRQRRRLPNIRAHRTRPQQLVHHQHTETRRAGADGDNLQQQQQQQPVQQYRIQSRVTRRGCWGVLQAVDEFYLLKAPWLEMYLLWTFETSLGMVFFSTAVMFILLALFFAAMFYVLSQLKPVCISVEGETFDETGRYFSDMFALSWQTLTTCGYGNILPAISTDRYKCSVVNLVAALESFTGVLFVGFSTAVVFGKVLRIQADANVSFSDPIVVRYGHGVLTLEQEELDASDTASQPETMQYDNFGEQGDRGEREMLSRSLRKFWPGEHFPCPILEFRILNLLYDQVGGGIMNARINVVAVTNDSRSSFPHQQQTNQCRRLSIKHRHGYSWNRPRPDRLSKRPEALIQRWKHGTILQRIRHGIVTAAPDQTSPVMPGTASSISTLTQDQTTDEELASIPTMTPLPVILEEEQSDLQRHVFAKLQLYSDEHPFFQHCWTVRHCLDDTSPLLSDEVKHLIKANGGLWPKELNNYKEVRKHIRFQQIIVNFSGTANISGNSVYAQKIYHFVDMNIGYRFANMGFIDHEGNLNTDTNLLNDVTEQFGGGAEPFTDVLDVGSIPITVESATSAALHWCNPG